MPSTNFLSYQSGVIIFPSSSQTLGMLTVDCEVSAAPRVSEYMSSGLGKFRMFKLAMDSML